LSLRVQAIASGSNGNCFLIDSPEGALLVDAGISRKKILEGLQQININPNRITGILVTHSHGDHIQGLPVLSDFIDTPVFATEATISNLNQMDYLDERWISISENAKLIKRGKISKVGPFKIITVRTEHDISGAVAYRINYPKSNVTISVVTDTGEIVNEKLDKRRNWQLSRSDLILLESNHDIEVLKNSTRPPSLKKRIRECHLSNNESARILEKIQEEKSKDRIKAVILGHLSGECNSPELVREWVRTWVHNNDPAWDWFLAPRDKSSDFLEVSFEDVKVIRKFSGQID
jgi:phosphoribosyl 1,2-cyclic phosphodiesterase